MKTRKFYLAASVGLLLWGAPSQSLRAQAPACPLVSVPLSPGDEQAPLPMDEVLCQAMGLSEEETRGFLPLFDRYQRELERLRKKHPLLWGDSALLDPSVTEVEAWISVASLMGYEKANARLQRKMARRISRLLPPRKVAQFFLLERQSNPVIETEGNDLMTILETN